ncbi:hypothetical protein HPB51_008538 [Rhipicephalus microplus]|uniref:M13 family peptidase n=1 Tax=Rhipicephalus microplus TaxID=6941 RepID=A0A9J6ERT7_RHIMP|nr:hypothetical protein HPB51_008538 [Rhipicephalus microplus]
MAQNSAAQEDASDSETELEFVTADFTELCLVGFGLVALIVLVAALAWYLFFYVPDEDAGGRRSLNYTRLLEESITRSVAPCDNFYRFVCTGWIRHHGRGGQQRSVANSVQREALLDAKEAFEEAARNHWRRHSTGRTEIDEGVKSRDVEDRPPKNQSTPTTSVRKQKSTPSQWDSAVLKAASLFESCKDVVAKRKTEAGKVAEFMKKYTRFPAVEPQNSADLVAAAIELSLTWRIDTLFTANVFANLDENGRPTVEIGENVELFHWFRWRNVLKDSGKLEEFFLSHLQAVPNFRSSHHEYLLSEIAEADSQVIPSLSTDEALPIDLTYRNLSALIPDVSYRTWVDEISKQTEPYFKVEVEDKLRVQNIHYLQQVGRILNYTGKPLLMPIFVGWTLLRQLAPRASYKAATFVFKDRASYIGACFAYVVAAMPLAAAYPYLSKLPTTRTEAVVRTIVKDLRRELATLFANVPWMDNTTRTAASNKLAAMSEVLVRPAFLTDESALDEHYANFSTRGEFLTASLETAKSSTRHVMAMVASYRDGVVGIGRLEFPPLGVNARYKRKLNAIVVPAGLMRPPFVDDDAWTAFNYAGFGAVVGHEMMHGFDSRGQQRDARGTLRDLWTTDVRKRYDEKLSCLRRAYDVANSRDAASNFSSVFEDEDVADFASLSVVLGAYRHRAFLQQHGAWTPASFLEFSREQLFYLNYCFRLCSADEGPALLESSPRTVYAMDEDRCNVPLRHLQEFADAFKCAKRDPMHVEDKCSFWDLPVEQLRKHEDALALESLR